MIKPSAKVLNKMWTHIETLIERRIKDMMASNVFDVNKQVTLYEFPAHTQLFEDMENGSVLFNCESHPQYTECTEYIVYHVTNQLYKGYQFNVFEMKVVLKNHALIYEPSYINRIFPTHPLLQDVETEYQETVRKFSSIDVKNHTTNSHVKVTMSLQGMLFGKPDREYYLYFYDNFEYTIQVFKIDKNNKRLDMLFGFWIYVVDGIKQYSVPYGFCEKGMLIR